MGGTFNPPHKGHMNAACAAKREIPLDKLILIPAGIPPHKKLAADSAAVEDRLAMTRLVAEEIGAEVSDIEIMREGKSYTVDTLREIKKAFPEDSLWLIMGTDMFLSLESWREPQEIFSLAAIAVIARDEKDKEALAAHSERLGKLYGAESRVIETASVTISSSELRPDIMSEKHSAFLSDSVYNYIIKKKLYGVRECDEI